jgi:TonB family protein
MHKEVSISIAILCLLAVSSECCAEGSAIVVRCNPIPKVIHVESVSNDRESRVAHQGRVVVAFTIEVSGHVRDPVIIESSDPWFNETSLQSVLLWRYDPPKKECSAQVPITYKLS